MPKQKVVFIDDEQSILDGLRRMLHDQRDLWEMQFFNSPMDALQQMRQEIFDAAVVDVNMPGMTGLDFLTEVKNDPRTRETEVIILTGLQEDSLKRQALNGGASDLLNKPIQKEDLLARLRSALRGKALRDQLERQHSEADEQRLAAQRGELIGSLLGQAARSLRDVLTSVLWYDDLAGQMLNTIHCTSEESSSLQEPLTAIADVGERARQLLDYILRLSTNGGEERQPCDVCQMTLDVARLMAGVLPKGVEIESQPEERELLVSADPAQLFQLLLNLALFCGDNIQPGQKFLLLVEPTNGVPWSDAQIPNGKVQPAVRVTVQASRCWLTDEVLQELIKGEGGAQRDMPRSAADLSVACRIAKSLGGRLEGHANPQHGTCFTLHLPRLTSAVQLTAAEPQLANA